MRLIIIITVLVFSKLFAAGEPMLLTFDTNLSSGTTIEIPLGDTVDVIIDWGDETQDTFTTVGNKLHTYSTNGIYNVSITGLLTQFGYRSPTYEYRKSLTTVSSWGDLGFRSFGNAFHSCTNLTTLPDTIPSTVTYLNSMFAAAHSFNQPIGSWDVSNVINMNSMFAVANSFNQDISNWNVENVTSMNGMFREATSFNQDISIWNVSNVTDMSMMFCAAISFNHDIENWNVSNVTKMNYMFYQAHKFNKSLNNWNVGKVRDMTAMFRNAFDFNGIVEDWDVSNVNNMSYMFYEAGSFNQNLANWNVSQVFNMYSMFGNAESFNQDISNWNVSSVTNMGRLFYFCKKFNNNISNWDVSSVTDMGWMFYGASSFNQDVGKWDVSNVTAMSKMFYNAGQFNQNIGNWDVSSVTTMAEMFYNDSAFNQDISEWNLSNVTDINRMFYNATSFNQDIGKWNVSNVTNTQYMFSNAQSFDQDLGNWDIRNVAQMTGMFNEIKLSLKNYNSLLKNWSKLNLQNDVTFGGGNSNYSSASSARQHIIDTYGWTITDGGEIDNSAPILSSATNQRINEDSTIIITLDMLNGVSDIDGDSLIIVIGEGSDYTFTDTSIIPNQNFYGELIIPITLSDGLLTSNTIFMTVNVINVDDAPIIINTIPDIRVDEDAVDSIIDISNIFSDIDNIDSLITKSISVNTNDTLLNATINNNTLTLDFLENQYGNSSIEITGTSNGKTVSLSFNVTVNSIPDISTILRDSSSTTTSRDTIIESKLIGEYEKEDTLIITTVTDTITDSYFTIIDTLTENVLTSSSDPTLDSTNISFNIISIDSVLKEYQQPVTISQLKTNNKSNLNKLVFAPNPVNSNAEEVTFSTPVSLSGEWKIKIYDNLGNLIDHQQFHSKGGYKYKWNLRNVFGQRVGSGIYLAVISIETSNGEKEIFKKKIGVKR